MTFFLKNFFKAFLFSVVTFSFVYGHDERHHQDCNQDDHAHGNGQQNSMNEKLPENMDKMLEELLAGLLVQQQGGDASEKKGVPGAAFDQDSFLKLIIDMYNQHREEALRKKRELLDTLSEDMKLAVVAACTSYEDVASRINISATLQMVIELIANGLRNLESTAPDTGEIESLLIDLEKLYHAVMSNSFARIIQGIPQSQDLPMPINPLDVGAMATAMGCALQPEDDRGIQVVGQSEPFSLDTLTLVTEKLGLILASHEVVLNQDLHNNIAMLHDILTAVGTQKVDVIAKTYFKYVLTSLDSTEHELTNAMTLLKMAIDERKLDVKDERYSITNFTAAKNKNVSQNELMSYALVIWYKDLKRYKNTIGVFKALEASVKPGKNPKTSLFRALSYSYDFIKDLYTIYGQDTFRIGFFNDSSNYFQYKVPVALTDWMLRAGMAGWYYSDMSAENTKGVVLNAMTGGLQLQSLTPVQQLIYKFAAVPLALPVLYKPSFWFKQPHEIMLALRKTLASWVYYHVVYRSLKDTTNLEPIRVIDQNGEEREVPSLRFLLGGASALDNHGHPLAHGPVKLWDKDYFHIKSAVFGGVAEINRVLCRHIHEEIRGKIDPGVLYTIHQYTWGIVKPEIIGEITRTLLPLLFLEKPLGLGEIANCNRNDVYAKNWLDRVRVARAGWTQRDGSFNENAFYIEQQMLAYIFGSAGNFWGNKVATTYKSQIMSFLGKVGSVFLDCCETIGLISEDQNDYVHDMKDELVMDIDENLEMLKMVVQSVFNPNSPYRRMIVMQLHERDYLNDDIMNDPIEVNKVIVEFALTRMSEGQLISYLDAATLINMYKENPENTAWIVDKTVDVIKNTLIGQFGGYIGSFLLTGVSDWLSWEMGPLYPRVKNAIL